MHEHEPFPKLTHSLILPQTVTLTHLQPHPSSTALALPWFTNLSRYQICWVSDSTPLSQPLPIRSSLRSVRHRVPAFRAPGGQAKGLGALGGAADPRAHRHQAVGQRATAQQGDLRPGCEGVNSALGASGKQGHTAEGWSCLIYNWSN